jgi:uncharacterized protein (DUF58 family)
MTRRYHLHLPGLIYVGLAFLVALAAMNRQNNLLFAALGIMVAGLAVSGLVSGLTLRGLKVQRILTRHGAVGRPLVVRYALTNRNGLLPAFGIHIEERAFAGPRGWGRLMAPAGAWVMHVGPRESAHGEAVFWPTRRGEARFAELRVWTTFPFGIIKKSITFDQPQHTLICPRLYALQRRVLEAVGPRGLAGVKNSPRPPDPVGGDDYWGMRDYRPGDGARSIAWKRSACLDRIVVLERTTPAPPRLRVVLNLGGPSTATSTAHSLQEKAIALAASIIHDADRRGIEIGLSVPGAGLPALPIRHSHWHREKLMGALASIDLETLRKGRRRAAHATDSVRAAQIVVHAERVEPALGRQDAWHFSARQLETLVSGPIGWTIPQQGEAPAQPEPSP